MLPHWIWGPESILEFSFQYECQRMSRASALTQLGDTPILLRHPSILVRERMSQASALTQLGDTPILLQASALTQLGDTPILLRHPAMAKAKGSIEPEKCNGSKRNRDCTQPEPNEIGRKCA
jgi:hypothetical protein